MTSSTNTGAAGGEMATGETPTSPSSRLALSRFEFETGKGNEGTKILMVEWDASAGESAGRNTGDGDDWEVLWDGKPSVLQVHDANTDVDEGGGHSRRVYFFLPPGASVPALVTIAHKGRNRVSGSQGSSVLRTKPMPAIFPAELGGEDVAGRRGVLHTIWGKKRLAELEAEIAAEMQTNSESVGLEIAIQERQWIVDHFGLGAIQGTASKPAPALHIPQNSINPASPRSPVGGRLGEKLRGLKLATSPSELAAATQASRSAHPSMQPLVRSLSAAPDTRESSSVGRTILQDSGSGAVVASLDAIVGKGIPPASASGANDNTEEDLFALPLSPRSPEMKKSPFSLL